MQQVTRFATEREGARASRVERRRHRRLAALIPVGHVAVGSERKVELAPHDLKGGGGAGSSGEWAQAGLAERAPVSPPPPPPPGTHARCVHTHPPTHHVHQPGTEQCSNKWDEQRHPRVAPTAVALHSQKGKSVTVGPDAHASSRQPGRAAGLHAGGVRGPSRRRTCPPPPPFSSSHPHAPPHTTHPHLVGDGRQRVHNAPSQVSSWVELQGAHPAGGGGEEVVGQPHLPGREGG